MISFLHIADKKHEQSIIKNGIRAGRRRAGPPGVYAVPVVPNYSTTHQWSRELKRQGARTLICVQFRIPDDECVFLGKYCGEKLKMTAAETVSVFLRHRFPMGLEVIIPRRIMPKEISRTYPAPRITGWRFFPEAKGKKPICRCKYCNCGEIRARRLIERRHLN